MFFSVTFRIFLPNILIQKQEVTVKKKLKGFYIQKIQNALLFYLEFLSPKDCTTCGRKRDFALLRIQTRLLNVLNFYVAKNFVY